MSLTIAPADLTYGQIRAAVNGAPAFIAALQRLLDGTGDFADGELVADEALAAAVLVAPGLAPYATIATVAISIAPIVGSLIEAGAISPGSSLEGQTTPPGGGWVGR